jgi:hypothetical protein
LFAFYSYADRGFSGGYHEYFGPNVDEEGVVYLMLVCLPFPADGIF